MVVSSEPSCDSSEMDTSDRISAIELNTAITCASLPFAEPLLRNTFLRLLGITANPTPGSRTRNKVPAFSRMPTEAVFD